MEKLFPAEFLDKTTYGWLPQIKVKSQLIYVFVLLFVVGALVLLPFIKVDVTLSSPGQIRPEGEKNELKSLVSGVIAKINVKEGEYVTKGQSLLILHQEIQKSKLSENGYQQGRNGEFLHDLQLLTHFQVPDFFPLEKLQSPLYKQQYSHFKFVISEARVSYEKAKNTYELNKKLFDQRVISQKEFSDYSYDYQKNQAGLQALAEQQIASWEQDYNNFFQANHKLSSENKQLSTEISQSEIIAPVNGYLQQFSGKYTGAHIQAGDVVGITSPDSALVSECYVSPKDIGFVRSGMPVRFQIDAFNYNEWGIIAGIVSSVDNDIIILNDKPIFRVRCTLNKKELRLKNGYTGKLKKGMTLQAHFLLTRRSLFQLLYDHTDNWLNPNNKS